ncbi:MAG: damage-inducible protein DinB [Ignavibacteriae bacterium]|nr:damage-inducible protein DinB [Ignavibacteriota bacterium]
MENILKTLLDYNDFSNRRYIEVLTTADGDLERELFLFSHILNGQHLWNARISDGEFKYKVWQVHDKNDFMKIHEQNQAETKKIVDEDDMDRAIMYSNTAGNTFTNTVSEMLLQALNHGTYHRGQIAQLLRAKEIDPPGTDYITFEREGQ